MRYEYLNKDLLLIEDNFDSLVSENSFEILACERDKEDNLNFINQGDNYDKFDNIFDMTFPELSNVSDKNNLFESFEGKDEKLYLNFEMPQYFFIEKEEEINYSIEKKDEKEKIFMIIKEKNQLKNVVKRGRKRKDDTREAKHTKYSDDNIIRKIKRYTFRYINETLNKAKKSSYHKFEYIPYDIIKKSSNSYNICLMNSTLKEIYEESINHKDKYKTKNLERNKKFLEYLSKEENEVKEKKVIDLLNLNFIQFFNDFIKGDIQAFLNKIRKSTEENKESNKDKNKKQNNNKIVDKIDLEKYLNQVEKICNNFETYFLSKI